MPFASAKYFLKYKDCSLDELHRFIESRTNSSKQSCSKLDRPDALKTLTRLDEDATINFLGFPPELRKIVYELILDGPRSHKGWQGTKSSSSPWSRFTSILRVSKQIHDEALGIFYAVNAQRVVLGRSFVHDPDSPIMVTSRTTTESAQVRRIRTLIRSKYSQEPALTAHIKCVPKLFWMQHVQRLCVIVGFANPWRSVNEHDPTRFIQFLAKACSKLRCIEVSFDSDYGKPDDEIQRHLIKVVACVSPALRQGLNFKFRGERPKVREMFWRARRDWVAKGEKRASDATTPGISA